MPDNFSLLDLERNPSEWKYLLPQKLLSGGAVHSGIVFIILGPSTDPKEFLSEMASKWGDFLKRRVWEEMESRTLANLKNKGLLHAQIVKHWIRPSMHIIQSPKTKKFGIKLTVSPTIPVLMRPLQSLKGKYFWSASSSQPVAPGFRVPATTIASIPKNPSRMKAEIIAEEIRIKDFRGRPSRLNSVFVCPALDGFCGRSHHRKGGVYEVEVKGRTFETDGVIFTDIAMYAQDEEDNAKEAARRYWEGTSRGELPEILVQGTVTVIRQVF